MGGECASNATLAARATVEDHARPPIHAHALQAGRVLSVPAALQTIMDLPVILTALLPRLVTVMAPATQLQGRAVVPQAQAAGILRPIVERAPRAGFPKVYATPSAMRLPPATTTVTV